LVPDVDDHDRPGTSAPRDPFDLSDGRDNGRIVTLFQFGDGHLRGPVEVTAGVMGEQVEDRNYPHFFKSFGARPRFAFAPR
jgi:hypothetical protein